MHVEAITSDSKTTTGTIPTKKHMATTTTIEIYI